MEKYRIQINNNLGVFNTNQIFFSRKLALEYIDRVQGMFPKNKYNILSGETEKGWIKKNEFLDNLGRNGTNYAS